MVHRDDLVLCIHHLGVQRADDGLLHNLWPLASGQLDGVLLHRLQLGLTDLEHERPVGAFLGVAVLGVAGIALQTELSNFIPEILDVMSHQCATMLAHRSADRKWWYRVHC